MDIKESYILLLNALNDLKNYLYSEKIEHTIYLRQKKLENNYLINNNPKDNSDELYNLKNIIHDCTKCEISKTRQKVVFGKGNIQTPLMIIGEAPGEKEDQQGLPFVGKSGNLLTKMLEAIGINREKVFISNIIKCRPPENRNPNLIELQNCSPYLEKQILLIQPKIILTLGNFSSQFILDKKNIGISKLRGFLFPYPKNSNIRVLATYHPSAILRNTKLKPEVWEDFKKLREFLIIHSPKIF